LALAASWPLLATNYISHAAKKFAEWYTLAKQMQIEDLFDQSLEISRNNWVDREGPDGNKYRYSIPTIFEEPSS
jgi:hypothetical protein